MTTGGPASVGPNSSPPEASEPEGLTDIRRNSRMTAALDLKQGLDVSEPMPLDDLPDDIARELSDAGGEDAPTLRLRITDLQHPAEPAAPGTAEAKPKERT